MCLCVVESPACLLTTCSDDTPLLLYAITYPSLLTRLPAYCILLHTPAGYNEGSSRLPRREGSFIIRQVIYDATYYTVPSASWSFLPLTCGSPDCEYEPLSANLEDFEGALGAHLLAGVSAFLYQVSDPARNHTRIYACTHVLTGMLAHALIVSAMLLYCF